MAGRTLQVVLAQPRGFCAGVVRAIEIVERALEIHGPPVYVRHEIVHNKHVVERLKARGAVFVEEVDEVPPGAVTIFSAHGVSRTVESDAAGLELEVIDATCPLVSKVHKEAQRYSARGYDVVLIGHRGHPEVEGTMGQVPGPVHLISTAAEVESLRPRDPDRLAYVTQTTLSVDDTRGVIATLKRRFPAVVGPDVRDICYATQNRQTAVRRLVEMVDVLLVVGAHYSSNSNRLREIGTESGIASYLVCDGSAVDFSWLDDAESVGVTAGASAPEDLVQDLIARLATRFDVSVSNLDGVEENVTFGLPPEVAQTAPA